MLLLELEGSVESFFDSKVFVGLKPLKPIVIDSKFKTADYVYLFSIQPQYKKVTIALRYML